MTRFNNKYPYTDFHELNADWLLETVKDAAAEAQEASDTVATYNDRLTTVEGDLAPIKAAMPGIASDVSDLQHDVGIMDSLITNTINPGLDTLQNEVETPSTGLLDRMTAAESSIGTLQGEVETPVTGLLDRVSVLENQPSVGGITEYLRFGTGGTPIDWDPRITYTYLDDLIATTASADKTVNIVLVEDDELGTTWYYTLNEGRYQISAGTPRGGFAFTCRKPVLDGNNVVIGYNVCTVDVDRNSATPTYTEVYEAIANNGITYSTTEHVIGKWIDDSDIYEKTFHVGSLPNNTTAQIVHDISNLGRVIDISGTGYSNSGVSIGIPYVNTSVQNQLACYLDGVYLYLNTAGDLSQYDGYVTIKYLKTV